MYGFKKGAGKAERKSFANGGAVDDGAKATAASRGSGMVRGPGTGTSDDVKDAVPPGTYIMPADSTQEIGPEALGAAGFRPGSKPKAPNIPGMGFGASAQVPVNLSNGEFRLSPEQVHAIGVQVLEGMKAATHASAEQQEQEDTGEAAQPERSRDELYFADGGTVRKPPPVDIAQGLREAVIDPIVSDVRQGNRVLQQEYPLAYQAAQLHPVVGIPAAGLNYADAMQKGDTQGAIAASLSSIPLAEKAYKVGNAIASGVREIVGNGGFRAAANNLGRRFGAGEQTAESFEAGQQQGQQMVNPNGLNFVDGGLVDDPNKKRPLATSPTNTYPGNQAERAGNIYAQSNADLARWFSYLNRGDPVKDAVSAVGGFFADSAAKARQPNAWDDSGTKPQFAAPAVAPKPAAPPAATAQAAPTSATPAATAASPDAKTGGGMDPTPPNSGPVPYTVTPVENTNGVQRINQKGQSPLFTNIDPGQAVAEMKGNPVGVAPAAAPSGRGAGGGPDVMGILQRESQIRAGMGELQDQINFNGGNGIGFRQRSPDEALRDMMFSDNLKARSAALGFASGNRDAAQRSTQTAQELALRQQEMQGREALQARYEAAKTPEERSTIAQQIRDLSGKEFQNRFTVVPGGQEWDANAGAMRNVPGRVINNQTGLDVERPTQGAGQQPQAMPADKAQRKAGMVYVLADGRRVKWDGTGATEVK